VSQRKLAPTQNRKKMKKSLKLTRKRRKHARGVAQKKKYEEGCFKDWGGGGWGWFVEVSKKEGKH